MAGESRVDMIEGLLEHDRLKAEAFEETRNGSHESGDAEIRIEQMVSRRRERHSSRTFDQLRHLYLAMCEEQFALVVPEVDTGYWGIMPRLSLDEAAALLLGRDPEWLDEEIFHAPFSVPFDRMRKLISRAQECGELPSLIPRADLFEWARKQGVPFSEEIERQLLTQRTCALEAEVEQLRAELAAARARVDHLESSDRRPEEPDANPRIVTTLYKMIYAMAVEKFSYEKPEPAKSPANAIRDAADKVGLTLDPKSISSRLNEARPHLESKGEFRRRGG